jgi:GrpB-like predicted nucleotidyltransferase (UPF0157 family)
MLGLKRGTVQLSEHEPEWHTEFATHAQTIQKVTRLDPGRIQHVGSTAVSGLVAKPIVDIVVGVGDRQDVDRVAASLSSAGYIDRGFGEGSTGRLLVAECAPEVRTVHIHVVEFNSQDWDDYVVFRNRLSGEDALRVEYGQLKLRLASQFPNDRKAYTAAKQAFIRNALGE